jgi:hypothetical protein
MPTIWSPYNNCPLTFYNPGPLRMSLCHWCGEQKISRRSYFLTPASKHLDRTLLNDHFCNDCFDVYRIYRPSDEELQLRIHQRYIKTADDAVSEALPVCLKDIVKDFIGKYPEI